MKRVVKWIFRYLPVVIWLCLVGSCTVKQIIIDRNMQDPNGLSWGSGDEKIVFTVKEEREGETHRFTIQAHYPDNRLAHSAAMTIDEDMYGGGFVKAMQADNDPEREVVAWGLREDRFYLDYEDGQVKQKSFSEASSSAQETARRWHQYHVMDQAGTLLLTVAVVCYYIVYGFISGIIYLVRRKKPGNYAQTSG